jgi:hypothetical protein
MLPRSGDAPLRHPSQGGTLYVASATPGSGIASAKRRWTGTPRRSLLLRAISGVTRRFPLHIRPTWTLDKPHCLPSHARERPCCVMTSARFVARSVALRGRGADGKGVSVLLSLAASYTQHYFRVKNTNHHASHYSCQHERHERHERDQSPCRRRSRHYRRGALTGTGPGNASCG